MTRQEAIEKLSTIGHISVSYAEDLYDSFFPKPVVPQYVADWYEEHKDEFEINLYREVCRSEENYERGGLTDFQKWLISGKVSPFSVLVNMHQFGYEVEKEPRYTVRVKGIKGDKRWLAFSELTECWWFGTKEDSHYVVLEHTHKELEANGFGWVFDCEGVEVKEVE
ncbi:MAG: Protein of unknown function (DUF1642) [Bacteriophage sp.]|jgi:gp178|nr:MAG: Protein of unknown function (DUF1642) [Bacteriophage sp.]DAX60761.1 MAG TPA: Protein of unknown function (DUF1642) [Caudoviricetes sp.]